MTTKGWTGARLYSLGLVLSNGTTQGLYFALVTSAVLSQHAGWTFALQLAAQALPALAIGVALRYGAAGLSLRSIAPLGLAGQLVVDLLAVWFWLDAGYTPMLGTLIGFGLSLFSAVQVPGRRAILVDLLGRDVRAAGIARVSALSNVARLLAPAGAGVALSFGAGWVLFAIDAAVSVVGCLQLLSGLRRTRVAKGDVGAGSHSALQANLRTAMKSAWPFLLAYGGLCLFGLNVQVIAPLLGTRFPDAATTSGILVSTHTAGAVIGSVVAARIASRSIGLMAGGIGLLGLGLLALLPALGSVVAVGVVMFVAGVGRGAALTASTTISAMWSESSGVRDAVLGVSSMIFSGSNLLGGPLLALLNDKGGVVLVSASCGVGCVVACGAWTLAMRRNSDWSRGLRRGSFIDVA